MNVNDSPNNLAFVAFIEETRRNTGAPDTWEGRAFALLFLTQVEMIRTQQLGWMGGLFS